MARSKYPGKRWALRVKAAKRLKYNAFGPPGTVSVSQLSHAHLLHQSV
jgi:hypothetical protein